MRHYDFFPTGRVVLIAVLASVLFVPAGLGGASAQDTTGEQGTNGGGIFAVGAISNVQYEDGNPAWILSGSWKMRAHIPPANLPEAASVLFSASIRMVAVDGTAMHRHAISDFELTSWLLDDAVKTFNGTATVTFRDGPQNVPVSITIRNGGMVSIWIDSEVVDHFGVAPIYGTVLRVIDHTGGMSQGGSAMGRDGAGQANATGTPTEGLVSSSVNYHGNATGYLVYPENGTGLPSVIMIHEWRGLNQHIKDMAEQLAAEGYIVLAADLYSSEVATESDRARVLATEVRNNPQGAVENLQAAVEHVSSLPNVNSSRVASLGWCFGGDWSLQLALNAEQPMAATIIYYGRLVTDQNELSKISWPVLGIFGSEDQAVPVETAMQFDSALDASGVTNEIYIYEGVGHAFANPSGGNYAPEETSDAWEKTLDFLNRYV